MAQFSFQNQRIGQVLAAFLAFFILTRPETAGPQVGAFLRWLGDAASSFLVFIEGVAQDTPPEG